jgi:hypothetical protein
MKSKLKASKTQALNKVRPSARARGVGKIQQKRPKNISRRTHLRSVHSVLGPTPAIKNASWVQVNFRAPRSCKAALGVLARASGVPVEELGTDALLTYFGGTPMNPIRHRFVRQLMRKLNLIENPTSFKTLK